MQLLNVEATIFKKEKKSLKNILKKPALKGSENRWVYLYIGITKGKCHFQRVGGKL